MNTSVSATPKEVLGTCHRLELAAAALYKRFQGAATEPALIDLWETMSRAEVRHARLIEELATRRDVTVPPVSRAALGALVERAEAIRAEADAGTLTPDRMLSITTALEFSEMDDLFTAICRAAGLSPDEGRVDHLSPLIQAVLSREEGDRVLRHLLAAMLRLRRRGGPATSALDADRADAALGGH
ncbi:MAG TPA: hypothetical protein VKZ18_25060 [Polyangia bacterium]|nr:hypothetical protein [Polyangia bacterium]